MLCSNAQSIYNISHAIYTTVHSNYRTPDLKQGLFLLSPSLTILKLQPANVNHTAILTAQLNFVCYQYLPDSRLSRTQCLQEQMALPSQKSHLLFGRYSGALTCQQHSR